MKIPVPAFILVLSISLIRHSVGSYEADEFLKSKITKIQSKLKEEEYQWNKERYELMQANKELTKQNNELWDENVDYIKKTANKEFENLHLKSQMKMWMMAFSGMLTVIIIINIMGYLIFGYKCYRSLNCCKSKRFTTPNLRPLLNDEIQEPILL